MTESLLNNNNNNNPAVDPNKNYLEDLVGDDKKYKTVEDLAKSRVYSDIHIQSVERENAELREDLLRLREEYNAGPKLQELLDQLVKTPQQQTPSNVQTPNVNELNKQPVIDPNQIKSLVSQSVQEIETQRKQDANFNQVLNKLKERFGDNYQATLENQLKSLGIDATTLDNLARQHPQVAIKTLGLDQEPVRDGFQSPPPASQRSDLFAGNGKKRTWSYYQELRKKDPSAYYNPKNLVQMEHDAIALGDEFKDGNWRVLHGL